VELSKGQKQTGDELTQMIEEMNARLLALPEGTWIGVNDATDQALKVKTREATVTIIAESPHKNELTYVKVQVGEGGLLIVLEADEAPEGILANSEAESGSVLDVDDLRAVFEEFCERWEVKIESF